MGDQTTQGNLNRFNILNAELDQKVYIELPKGFTRLNRHFMVYSKAQDFGIYFLLILPKKSDFIHC